MENLGRHHLHGWKNELDPRDLELFQHYVRHLGQPEQMVADEEQPEGVPCPIYVLEFPPPAGERAWVYTTLGASRQPMSFPEPRLPDAHQHRIELLVRANERHTVLIELLQSLAIYPHVTGSYFGPGHTIAGSPGHGVVPGSPLTEIYLTQFNSGAWEFWHVDHADGTHTELLLVVPVHPAERTYVKQRGWRALEACFAADATDVGNLWRPAVV